MNKYTYPDNPLSLRAVARAARVWQSTRNTRIRNHQLKLGIIGFPKCGTTTLHRTLLETGRYNGVNHETQARDYLTQPLYANVDLVKNPNLVYEPWWMNALEKRAGPSKYIICIRDPIVALHSFYWYRIREADDPTSWIPNKQRRIVPQESSVMLGEAEFIGASRTRINYRVWIEHLIKFIAVDQIHFVILEELSSNRQSVQERICNFLGMDIDLRSMEEANVNQSKPKQIASELEVRYGSDGFYQNTRIQVNEILQEHWNITNYCW